jgi:glyoxylase-like metal-dependent hydrolase (beta-lactamase superfamily II)
MILKQIPSGYDRNFAYLVADEETKEAAVIDPSQNTSIIKEEIKGFQVKYIINTHSHPDHTMGNGEIKEITNAKIVQHEDSPKEKDISVKDNEELKLGSLILKFIHTPGHAKDHICILVEKNLFTGDLLFVGNVGGVGEFFPGSSMKEELESLKKIIKLPESTKIWPGHDYGIKPHSTIEFEKENNPIIISLS